MHKMQQFNKTAVLKSNVQNLHICLIIHLKPMTILAQKKS